MLRRRVPYVAQMEGAECGSVCLAMVLAYHGKYVPLTELREICAVSRDGANALSLVRGARRLGLEAEGVRLEPEHLGDLPLPAILHWDLGHFVVLEQLTARGAVVVDPGTGTRHVSRAELADSFTGVAVALEPSAEFARNRRPRPAMGRYWAALRGFSPTLTLVAISILANEFVGLALPIGNQVVVDQVVRSRELRWLVVVAASLVVATVAKSALDYVRKRLLASLGCAVDTVVMARFVEHLLTLPSRFFEQRDAGDLMARAHGNRSVRETFARTASALLDGLLVLSYGGLLVAYDIRIGLVAGAARLAQFGVTAALRPSLDRASATELARHAREGAVFAEAFSEPEVTKAYRAEELLARRYRTRLEERLAAEASRCRIEAAASQVSRLLDACAFGAVLWLGGRAVLADRITVGILSSMLAVQALLERPLASLHAAVCGMIAIRNQLVRLDDVWSASPDCGGAVEPGELRGSIRLTTVSYRYSEGASNVVRDVSLEISPGEYVAIVGPTGSGKSTLGRLLVGQLRPSAGVVYLDGHDLRDLDQAAVRRQLGVVPQETFFFDGTMAENVAMGNDLDVSRIMAALDRAQVSDVVEHLEDGLDSRLGARAERLSGGQRQRVALARALASDAAILLLDEATSSLEAELEARIDAQVSALRRTRIVIAHRLAAARAAHRVLVMDEGRVVQEGTFASLSRSPGLFRDLLQAAS
jgi:ABC-type bacteriocin/lantibiotic exporter with double-glycine peptidase domain